MSKPMTPDQIIVALQKEGLTVRQYAGWARRCRCCPDSGPHNPNGPFIRSWGSVNGGVQHITGGDLGKHTVETYIRDIILGDEALPCKVQFVTAPDGVVWLVAAGRSNHAGGVGSTVRDHMIAANFSLSTTYDDRFRGQSADGNAFTYGNECIAATKMTDAQRASSVLLWTAIGKFHGWTGQEIVGHGEISSARVSADPNLNMGQFRKDIMAKIKSTSSTPSAPKPPAKPANTLTLLTNNVWGYGKAESSATQTVRLPAFVEMIEHYKPNMIAMQELSNQSADKKRQKGDTIPKTPYHYVVDNMHDLGYAVDTMGSDGRFILRDKDEVEFIKGKTILMKPEYHGDNKQAALGIYLKGNRKFNLASAHTENEGSDDKYRVGQVNSLVAQNHDWAKPQGVDTRWQIYAGDFNDHDNVLRAFRAHGFVDGFTLAPASHRIKAAIQSFAAYHTIKNGPRIDLFAIYKDLTVLRAEQITKYKTSDHHAQLIEIKL